MTYHPRFIQTNQYLTVILIVVGFTVFQQGCTMPHTYSYPGHTTFTVDNVNQLHTGMNPAEVQAIFGSPDKTYDASFGKDVGEPWTGRVWLYFTKVDPNFMHVKRYKKNLLVFYPPGEQMRLNHWIIEE
jgi:hypothetical protein